MKKLKSILLIDDDNTTNFINQLLLEDLEIADKITVQTGIEEALSFLKKECELNKSCPELILLDLHLQLYDGFYFLEKLESFDFQNKKNIKIIILSNSSRSTDIEKGKNYGVVDYLQKPLTAEAVYSIYNKHFNNHLVS